MLKNFIKTAIRNLLRNRTFSAINILGLAAGLTCCLLIYIFVVDEFSYDNFHSKADRIYRVRYQIGDFELASIPPIMSENIASFFPEVEKTARMYNRSVSVQVPQASGEVGRYEENRVFFSDASIFEIFDFESVKGSLDNALSQPYAIIINEEVAEKYFGPEFNPVGRQIILEGDESYQVAAVVKDFPGNSHLHFNMLVPYENMFSIEPDSLEMRMHRNFEINWMISHSYTYVLLKPGSIAATVNSKFPDFIKEKIPESQQKDQNFLLQPLADIHLNSVVRAQPENPGDLTFIYIFIAIGTLTLAIAGINFVNLSTARSLQRTKEIGIRKVLGSSKQYLIYQFLGESLITTFIASIAAIFFTVWLLPAMNELVGKSLTPGEILQPEIAIGFVLLFLLTSILAGLYPAFFATRISPIHSLKGQLSSRFAGGLSFRKVLVVIQFSISMILISSTLIVFDQLEYLRTKPLGFDREQVITVPLQSQSLNNIFGGVDGEKRQKIDAFEEELARMPGVVHSTLSATAPGFGMVNRNIVPEGFTAEDNMLAPVYAVDYDFIETYKIELVAGRGFSKDYGADHLESFVINEYAVLAYNFESPEQALGKSIDIEGKVGRVIGVVRDFNFLSLSEPIAPLVMEISVPQFNVFSIRLQQGSMNETVSRIEEKWNQFFPNETFDYAFLDDQLNQNYQAQENLAKLVGYFSALAIIISCLGSYGLIMFLAAQKIKEIGIRKVLGASVGQLVMLLSIQFVVLAMVGLLISVPVTWWASNQWLDSFSYRVDISIESFVISAAMVISLVLLTISFKAIRAAMRNPVDSLRSE